MSKLKHTKDPWRIYYNGERGFTIDKAYNDNCEKIICNRNPMVDGEEQTANALLISCAPEMLDLLIEITGYINPNPQNYIGFSSILNKKINNLIEKATGLTIEEVLNND